MIRQLAALAILAGIGALLGGIGMSAYWEVRGGVEIAKACFDAGGKSVTRGWRHSDIYCNK